MTVEREYAVFADPQPFSIEYSALPKSSRAIIDPFGDPKRRRIIPRGQMFVVRGEFASALPADQQNLGPFVIGNVRRGGVTMKGGVARSMWDPETKRFWFEMQILSPDQIGEATLSIEFDKAIVGGERQREYVEVPLSIAEEEPLASVGTR